MNWQDAVVIDGMCNVFGVQTLSEVEAIPFTAHELQIMLDAAVAAERERCVQIARRWGETHARCETVNARNAASKIARAIEGPNVRGNRETTA